MKQYLDLLQAIQERGTNKPPAREGMPGTLSLFGYQFRHDLSEGFPLLTTKKMFWKGVVVELLWFLRGDTNIKYLVDNGVNIWNEDAYNYYRKIIKKYKLIGNDDEGYTFDEFINAIKEQGAVPIVALPEEIYKLGDCGYQYGKLWRAWDNIDVFDDWSHAGNWDFTNNKIDQVAELINGLKSNPMGRRHIISAWNPATLDKMALHPCHVLVQFNCRPLTRKERLNIYWKDKTRPGIDFTGSVQDVEDQISQHGIPKYYLDCQLYQRSADVVLGVPFNIASYALLAHIMAKIVGMVPGEFIHTFGDVHIYDNHRDAVREQLDREPRTLPKLVMADAPGEFVRHPYETALHDFNLFISKVRPSDFRLEGYTPHPKLESETKLSTGLK